jgi:hypothetical protein
MVMAFKGLNAQSISIEVYQDAKFAFIGDKERGYKAGTLDILTRLTMQGKQDRLGYFTVSPQFEYADIKGIYKRYSFSVGYTFNQYFKNFEQSINIDYGFIDRFGKNFFSAGATGSIKYKITDGIKVVALAQLTDRKDLKAFYNETKTLRFSGFLGIEINIYGGR